MSKMIWKTHDSPECVDEYTTTRNVEIRRHENGIEIRVTRETLNDDPVSLSKVLSVSEAIRLGVEIVQGAKEHAR